MARFLVKASEFKNVCKAVNDRKLAELKKEIIEILKKQDEKEVKKAIDYFESQELHYTHLEKSFNGKWVEKAGYGVGTVRIWKGKKYKKIAPGKWARVFEKEGRGTNIAIGKLIAKVQKIDNVEDLMAFVMANKQRFVDENGVDLPVLDKLRAAVDARNGNVGSKETSKTAKKYDAKAYEEEKNNVLRHTNKDYDSVDAALKDMYAHKNWIDRKPSDETEHEKTVRESRLKAVDDIIEGLKNGDKKLLDKFVKDSKPAEKKESDFDIDSIKGQTGAVAMLKDQMETWPKEKLTEFYNDKLEKIKNNKVPSVAMQNVKNQFVAAKELLNEKYKNDESETEKKTDSKVYETEKEPSGIGTFEKIDTNTVEMPTDKATRVLFDNLNKSRSTEKARAFMTDCYYDGENIVSTDGKRLTIIKTGDVGFEPGYVNVKTDDGKITLERIEGKDKKYSFPNYKKVIPENNNQEVKLDNKALKDKLKQMKKEGAFNKKNPRVNLVFEDGKVMLDGILIGTGDVKFKDGENYVSFNGDFLNDAVLSGDNMSMSFGENSEKAVVFGSDIGKTVVMPMVQTPVDYENNRAIKKQSSNEKAAKLSNNRKENERLVNDSFKDIDGQVEKVYTNLDKKINAFSDEDLKRSYDILNLNLDKIMDRSIGFITKIVDKKTNATFSTAYAYSKLLEKHPDVKDKFLAELDRRGISVKKSLFDDFIVEVFEADEDEEIEDAIKTDESLFNDYSAEQPELFNSTELMVREAFNRCRVL